MSETKDGFPDKYHLLPPLETARERFVRRFRSIFHHLPLKGYHSNHIRHEEQHLKTAEDYIDMIAGAKHTTILTPETHPELFQDIKDYFHLEEQTEVLPPEWKFPDEF